MKTNAHILMIDDDPDILMAGKLALKKHFSEISTSPNPMIIPDILEKSQIDCVLLDMNYSRGNISGSEGLQWLDRIKERLPNTPVIMMTAYGDVNLAVDTIKKGASDFILKPWNNQKLVTTIQNALKLSSANAEIDDLKIKQKELNHLHLGTHLDLLGDSPAIKSVMQTIKKVAKTDANILLLGENGTGKGLIAKTIHQLSNRQNQNFIHVDLGAIQENLFASELFGHKKGSFTGAHQDRIGRFELANDGTLFLDEIGNIDASFQSKLLTALQNRTVQPVGGNKAFPINIRLISATNMPLKEMVKDRSFRQDLLYRINTVEIYLPPLRERKEDIEILARHYISKYCKQYNMDSKELAKNTLETLHAYHWPGNIRELQHAIERAIILAEGKRLEPKDFFLEEYSSETLEFKSHKLDEVEKHVIEKVLRQYQGNISKAAKELGLTRAALYRRLEKHGL